MRWFRRWRGRDDQHLVKPVAPLPDIDQIEELERLTREAEERDADDERRVERLSGPSPIRNRRLPKR
jgi:hypothetical protein